MVTVLELLALPHLKNFKLISGMDGLYNQVCGTGIFEWESPAEIDATFEAGEFVITTLSMAKNDRDNTFRGLEAIIRKRVAAIAIKTVYFSRLPDDMIALADRYRVPVFTFADTYIDDLIYVIKNAVLSNSSNDILYEGLKKLLASEDGEAAERAASGINPLFGQHLFCLCGIPRTGTPDGLRLLDRAMVAYKRQLPQHTAKTSCHTLIRCSGCLVMLCTADSPQGLSEDEAAACIDGLLPRQQSFQMGISHQKTGLAHMGEAVEEALVAAVSAALAGESRRHISETGADAFLLPNLHEKHFRQFYQRTCHRLTAYDKRRRSSLLKTLICYIESDGDVALTAAKLFQHGNTIRYRLDKIRKVLEIPDSPDTFLQLYIFVKIHKAVNLFGKEGFHLI